MTFPELFAIGLGVPLNPGPERCFWCGATCDQRHGVGVTDTFWDWDAVAFRLSRYQCAGCKEALNEKRDLGRDKLQKTRNYSWFVSENTAVALTKADLDQLRELCINPPADCRWGLAIAESGQKHIIYRTPVNEPGAKVFAVQLELTRVVYSVDELLASLQVCIAISAVHGKTVLNRALDAVQAARLPEPELAVKWNQIWNQPVVRLASFLCPNKEKANACLAEGVGG